MARTNRTAKLQTRDWAIVVLFVAVIGTNWIWYQVAKTNELNERQNASSWLSQQVQINKLKACIDENIRPCDITQVQQ